MQRPRLLIVAAPFGFGPAAKSLIIAHGLQTFAEITISSDRDAYDFIARHKSSKTGCIRGPFSKTFVDLQSLSAFDCFVSINHFPAIQHLALHGLASRTIFLDSLLPWRTTEAQVAIPPRLLAYLVQDYPGAAGLLDRCTARTVALTSPLMWPLAQDSRKDSRKEITLHLGGMTSPLATWEGIAGSIERLVSYVGELACQHGLTLTVIGSSHLKTLSLPDKKVNLVGDASPEVTAQLILRSKLLITTPGIGAVYESMAYDTPLILLPPMNSTQLHHYRVLTSHGIPGVMPPQLVGQLTERAGALDWEQQSRLCLRAFQAPITTVTSGLPALLGMTLACLADDHSFEQLMKAQRRLFSALSKTNTVDIVRNLLSQPLRASHSVPISDCSTHTAQPDIERYLLLLPKVELHVHLEGSLRPELLFQLAERNKLKLPFATPDQFQKHCAFGSFRDFANVLLLGVRCLRRLEDFFDVVIDIGAGMAQQNIRYAEITWTPQFYLKRGLSLDSILGAMNEARREVKARRGVELQWIPDLVRSYPAPASAVAKWAASRKAAGVVALGLGGPESGYPASGFEAQFQYAHSQGLPANPHAGEGMGPESVWETIQHLRPSRLGHGVRAIEDAGLVEYLARNAIPLEVCLTSNVKLGIYPSYADHPVKRLIDAGCIVSLNTDDPALFQTTLTDEYVHAVRDCRLDIRDIQKTILDSLRSSYISDDRKSSMQTEFELEFSRLDKLRSMPEV